MSKLWTLRESWYIGTVWSSNAFGIMGIEGDVVTVCSSYGMILQAPPCRLIYVLAHLEGSSFGTFYKLVPQEFSFQDLEFFGPFLSFGSL